MGGAFVLGALGAAFIVIGLSTVLAALIPATFMALTFEGTIAVILAAVILAFVVPMTRIMPAILYPFIKLLLLFGLFAVPVVLDVNLAYILIIDFAIFFVAAVFGNAVAKGRVFSNTGRSS